MGADHDQAFASESFNERIHSIAYSHGERETKLSDHSVLVLNVSEK